MEQFTFGLWEHVTSLLGILLYGRQNNMVMSSADWEKKDIVGSDIVRDVRTIPFVEGISTSEIIKKIQTIK